MSCRGKSGKLDGWEPTAQLLREQASHAVAAEQRTHPAKQYTDAQLVSTQKDVRQVLHHHQMLPASLDAPDPMPGLDMDMACNSPPVLCVTPYTTWENWPGNSLFVHCSLTIHSGKQASISTAAKANINYPRYNQQLHHLYHLPATPSHILMQPTERTCRT